MQNAWSLRYRRFINNALCLWQSSNHLDCLCGEIFWLLLIGIVHIHSGASKGLLAVMASLVLTTTIRSGISFVLILEPDRITTRTLIRTRSWAYSELQSAEGVVSSEKMGRRSTIVLRPKIGKPFAFKTLGEASDATPLTHSAVQQINGRIFYSALIHPMTRARA